MSVETVGLTGTGRLYHRLLPPSGGHFNNYWRTVCHFGWPVARMVEIDITEHPGRACTKCWPYRVRRNWR